jgi:hypothetical protein
MKIRRGMNLLSFASSCMTTIGSKSRAQGQTFGERFLEQWICRLA